MVVVDITHLDLNQLLYHILGLLQALIQQLLHYIKDSTVELVESLNLLDIDEVQHPSEFLMDQMRALQGWKQQATNLLFD